MAGCFIVSFDCEGKWGMADHLTDTHHRLLTDESLAKVYRDLVAMLGRHQMPATFAFVMAFLLDEAERRIFAEELAARDEEDRWMVDVGRGQAAGPQGWFLPAALTAIKAAGIHEIACHGFCHRSLGEGELSLEGALRELSMAERVARLKGIRLQTLVFPRNRVGNLQAVRDQGYVGYRLRQPLNGRVPAKLANLAQELDMFPAAEDAALPAPGELVAIPHGYFFNWRYGSRRLVPPAVTVRRWRNLLDCAANEGKVAHLWLHPHNFITGPSTWQPFEAVLAHAQTLFRQGRLELLTQVDYCQKMREASPAPRTSHDGPAPA